MKSVEGLDGGIEVKVLQSLRARIQPTDEAQSSWTEKA
jgi:hypothetical protein